MTERQQAILEAIVEAYSRTAEPVGSLVLAKGFGYSPATIRSEMAELERLGLIEQPHTSAGRIPTDKGYRLYVNSIQEPAGSSRVSQAMARRIQDAGEIDQAIRRAAESLAEITGNVGLATMADSLFYTGLSSLFGQPEFLSHPRAYEAARLLDHLEDWLDEAAPADPVSVYIGQENPIGKASGCSLIIARFESPYSSRSYIGILGPTRQSYGRVIGLVGQAGKLLEETVNE